MTQTPRPKICFADRPHSFLPKQNKTGKTNTANIMKKPKPENPWLSQEF